MRLAERISIEAHRLGFDLVGITSADPPVTAMRYRTWLTNGYHGRMGYLARPDAIAKRIDLARLLAGVQCVVTVAANYFTFPLAPKQREDPSRGIIASYAWGEDYHDVLTPRLRQLAASIETQVGKPITHRAYVDTGPLLERDLSVRAGLGFFGKNTNLIHPLFGSWLFLGELLLPFKVSPGEAFASAEGTCGQCTRCLDACPTGALIAPYLLDARRCISYLTIELKDPIPRELRPLMGNRIFGCDICQEVCPWNQRFAHPTPEPAFQPRPGSMAPQLLDLMDLDEEGFRRRFQGTPLMRTKRRGLLRNVAVALGNWGDILAVEPLVRALSDTEPLIRGHAAWALGRIPTRRARRALERAATLENEEWVQGELRDALGSLPPT